MSSTLLATPPRSLDAEKTTLGALLIDPDAMVDLVMSLSCYTASLLLSMRLTSFLP
jgi:hypothetical protein